jgi:PIN domain nuclease of toxin-antitoxin system
MIRSVGDDYHFTILYLHKEHYERYARLEINEAQKHYDPSDHIIIAHAITMNMPLISSDRKFPFYREQGLDLVSNF